ncbi:MAG TPA: ATP synthase F1 subunit delta [Longimicrobiaceae bacterium]|nr:ATP synthase F1 subunit delta [Longimicrobiaceae bacterium]
MRPTIIARNYAETLLTLAQRNGGDPTVDEYGSAIRMVADLLEGEPRIREFIESPLQDVEDKKRALRGSLQGRVPELFLRFLLVVVDKRRASVLRQIAAQYHELVDELRGRVRARVTLAREPDEVLRREIAGSLQRMLGREVLANFQVDRNLIGGVVVRVGDQVLDGSVRRRAAELRRRLLAADIPALTAF